MRQAQQQQGTSSARPLAINPVRNQTKQGTSRTTEEWERLSLKLQKAEKALEHERAVSDDLRRQLENHRNAASIGEQAAETIAALRRDLEAAQALVAQRTQEAGALQRAVHLGDETNVRLKQQLNGLFEASRLAVAREQEMERQVREIQEQLLVERSTHGQELEGIRQQLQQQRRSSGADEQQHAATQQVHEELTQKISQLEQAVAQAKAEAARKSAAVLALEQLLSQHRRNTGSPGPSPQPSVAPPTTASTVTTDISGSSSHSQSHHYQHHHDSQRDSQGQRLLHPQSTTTSQQSGSGLVAKTTRESHLTSHADVTGAGHSTPRTGGPATPTSLSGGLTDNQWKLVMLSEAVRNLRATVSQVRQASNAAPGQPLILPERIASTSRSSLTEVEVVEMDLTPEEVHAKVVGLAQQMNSLEEELQLLLRDATAAQNSNAGGCAVVVDTQGSGVSVHSSSPATAVAVATSSGTAQALQPAQDVKILTMQNQAGFIQVDSIAGSPPESGSGGHQHDSQMAADIRGKKRRGWLWWLFPTGAGNKNDEHVLQV